jgi:UDP-N-acetylmuramyl tripeptide synthase
VAPTAVSWRLRTALPLSRLVADASRLARAGTGTVLRGRVLLTADPTALRQLAADRRIAFVSGTNGKTTTTRLLAAAVATTGPVATNDTGANMVPGLVAALATAPAGAPAVLECDERYLPRAVDATRPAVVVLMNLSRDQLDRMGEVRTIASSWRELCGRHPETTVVANADDPLVAWAAAPARTVWVAAGSPWTADATTCPDCGRRIRFADDGTGAWACTGCDLARPPLDAWLTPGSTSEEGAPAVLETAGGDRVPLAIGVPYHHVQANAALAVLAARALGVEPAAAVTAMQAVADVDGRYRVLWGPGTEGRLFLAKNPAGWAALLDELTRSARPILVVINARVADGRDPSWLWDVPFERLAGRPVIAAGDRWRDLAVRLRYAEVAHTTAPDLGEALARARAGDADVAATYTAFRQVKLRVVGRASDRVGGRADDGVGV